MNGRCGGRWMEEEEEEGGSLSHHQPTFRLPKVPTVGGSSSQSPTSSGPLIPRGQTLGTGSSMPPRAVSRMYKPRGIDGGIRQ